MDPIVVSLGKLLLLIKNNYLNGHKVTFFLVHYLFLPNMRGKDRAIFLEILNAGGVIKMQQYIGETCHGIWLGAPWVPQDLTVQKQAGPAAYA